MMYLCGNCCTYHEGRPSCIHVTAARGPLGTPAECSTGGIQPAGGAGNGKGIKEHVEIC